MSLSRLKSVAYSSSSISQISVQEKAENSSSTEENKDPSNTRPESANSQANQKNSTEINDASKAPPRRKMVLAFHHRQSDSNIKKEEQISSKNEIPVHTSGGNLTPTPSVISTPQINRDVCAAWCFKPNSGAAQPPHCHLTFRNYC